jgi:hypothetical protein
LPAPNPTGNLRRHQRAAGEDASDRRLLVDSFRSGWIGRRLTPLLRRAGFVDVDVTGHLLVAEGVDAIDKVFDVKTTAARVAASTGDTSFGQRWWDALCTDEWPMAGVTVFLATGRKPSGESAPDVALGQAVSGSASTD